MSDIDEYFEDPKMVEVVQTEEDTPQTIVGIDLGTTNSCVCIWRNNNLEVIPDRFGNRTIPSVVAFTAMTMYVGNSAKEQIILNPENTYWEVKRLIGRKYGDSSVENDRPFFSYEIISDVNDNIALKTTTPHKHSYTPEEISAYILMELKHNAEAYLNMPVKRAVITVPAYFNDAQRQATKDAAQIAGLECIRIINEPTAAALAYGLEKKSKDEINVLVYDVGGGTTDTSLLNICDGVFEVIASSGNTHLGGADFDNRLVSHCKSWFKKHNKVEELMVSVIALQQLRKSCESAKRLLSTATRARIYVANFCNNLDLDLIITRDQFESICSDLFILCLNPVEQVLQSAGMDRNQVDHVILIGGVTRTPKIRDNLRLFFGFEPDASLNPDEAVAAGAAIQAYILENRMDPFSKEFVLLDIIPLTIGVETLGGVMTPLIPRNTVIPASKRQKFTTDTDYETSVAIKIFEGERTMTRDNFMVGEFTLSGLDSAPRGVVQIEIQLKVDVNGVVSITAHDADNPDNKQSIVVSTNKGRLSEEKILQLVEQAAALEIRDNSERRRKIMAHEIDNICSNILANINNAEYKIKPTDKISITDEINLIHTWLVESHTEDEYEKILLNIKTKYSTLIIRATNELANIKGEEQTATATSIYCDDLDQQTERDPQEVRELTECRENLTLLCTSVYDIITRETCKLSEEHYTQLYNLIDDTLMWTHVVEKPVKLDYEQKINLINKTCDEIMSSYDESVLECTTKMQLEQLCFTLKSSLECNMFNFDKKSLKQLIEIVDKTLNWLLDTDVKQETEKIIIEDSEYQMHIDSINAYCTSLYESMTVPLTLNHAPIITTRSTGTSLAELLENS